MPGTQNFESIVSARAVGTADVLAQADAIRKLAESIDGIAKKSENIKPPAWELFAKSAKEFIQDPLAAAGNAAEAFLLKIGPLGAAATVAAAGFGILAKQGYEWEKQLGALGRETENISVRTGLSIKEVGDFDFAMKRAGGSIDGVQSIMRKLSQGLADGGAEGKKAAEGLQELGIRTRDVDGSMVPMSSVILQISKNLGGMQNSAERNALAVKIMGRGALDALPQLLELSEGVARARELGLSPSNDDVKRWDSYQKQVAEVDALWEKLKRNMKEPIVAVVSFVIQSSSGGNNLAMDRLFRGKSAYLDGLGEPGPDLPLTYGISQSRSQHAAEVSTNQAAAKSLGTFLQGNLAGANDQLELLKNAYTKARTEAELLAQSGAVLPEVAEKAREKLTEAEAAYQRQSVIVKELGKDEERRVALLEKQRDLIFDQASFFVVGTGGPGSAVVTQSDIDNANVARSALERLQRIPRVISPAERSSLVEPLASGIQNAGLGSEFFVSASTDRTGPSFLNGTYQPTPADQAALLQHMGELRKAEQDRTIQSLHAEFDATERIVELRTGPGGELAAAKETTDLRLMAVAREYQITGDLNKARLEAQQIELDRQVRIEEIRKQGIEQYRNLGSSLFDAATSGQGGFAQFAKNLALTQGRTIAGNLAVEAFQKVSPYLGLSSKIFQGTLLGKDPVKESNELLKATTDKNSVATDANTQALRDLTAALAQAKAAALSPSGGGGGLFSPIGSTFKTLTGAEQIGLGVADAAGLARTSSGLVIRNADGDVMTLPQNYPSRDPLYYPGYGGGASPNANTAQGLSLSGKLGKGVGYAAAGIAAYHGISDISRGGAQGVLGGAGELAGAASAILMLAGVSGPAAPILAGVGLGLELVTSLFGDPKAERAKDLEAQRNARVYTAPTGNDYAVDLSGRPVNYDYRGTPQSVIYVSISAVDTQSMNDAIERSSDTVVRVVGTAVPNGRGEEMVGHLMTRMGLRA